MYISEQFTVYYEWSMKFHLTYFEQDFFHHLLAVIVHSHKATKRFSQKYHPVGGGAAIKSEHLAVQRCLF